MNISDIDPKSRFCTLTNHASIVRGETLYVIQGNGVYRIRDAASYPRSSVQHDINPWARSLALNQSYNIPSIGDNITTAFSTGIPQRSNPVIWNITDRYIAYSTGLPVGNVSETEQGNSVFFTTDFTSYLYQSGAISIGYPWTDTERYYASRNSYFDEETGSVYLVGGLVGDTPTNTFLTYSNSNYAWRNTSLSWGVTSGDGAMGSFKINSRIVHVYVGGTVNGEMPSLDVARVFDSRSNIWYDQPLTGFQGKIPTPRRNSCTTVVAAPDGSSYQMLMFGGTSGDESELPFAELWALNIPAFTWVLLDNSLQSEGQPTVPGPRFGSTCHLIKGNKLLVFGGSKIRDVGTSTEWTNCDLRQNAVFIMDLNELAWLENYDGERTDYQVPERIQQVIGGGPTGGATMVQPVSGFADPTLSEILRVPVSTASTTNSPGPTTSSGDPGNGSGGGLPTGAIVGIAIGVVLLAIGGLFFLYRWMKNRKRQALDGSGDTGGKSELPALSNDLGYNEQKNLYKDNAGNVIARQELGGGQVNRSELPAEDALAQHPIELPTKNETAPVELLASTAYAELPERNSTLMAKLRSPQLPEPPVPPKAPE
ncbi:hypothetical protein TWF281_005394 [Arthrobotrys megalospora]